MAEDPASFSNLHDLVEPAAVPIWPLAPGWWVLIAGGMLFVGILLWRAWRKSLRNAYRKEALSYLSEAESVGEVAAILKRCVRVSLSGKEINAFSEEMWIAYLAQRGNMVVPPEIAKSWLAAVYQARSSEGLDLWKRFADQWIRTHQWEENDD